MKQKETIKELQKKLDNALYTIEELKEIIYQQDRNHRCDIAVVEQNLSRAKGIINHIKSHIDEYSN